MHSHHLFFNFLRNRELNELYVSMAIKSFALSLTGVFVPIYLYQIGYSFSSIFLFFAMVAFMGILVTFPAAKISYRIGAKHSILLSMPFIIIFFLLLFSIEIIRWPLFLMALFMGIHTALFYFAYHVDFSKFSKRKSRGRQVGLSYVLIGMVAVLGPLLGGLILSFSSFKVLFGLVSILFFISTIPLFMSREFHEPVSFSLKGFFRGQKAGDIIAYLGNGAEMRLGTIVWPLFIFVFILGGRYITLGAVVSVALFFSLIIVFLASKFSDIKRKFVMRSGIVFNSITWVFKSFITAPIHVFVADAFYGASEASTHIPFDAMNYDKTRDSNRAKIIVQREVYIRLGGMILLIVMSFFADHVVQAFRYVGPLTSLMRFFF